MMGMLLIIFLGWNAETVDGLGCPCVGGLAFNPTSGPGRFVVPNGKLIEDEFQLFIENWLAQNLRGGFARATFNQPRDLRDYAYEHSKIMSLKGSIFFDNWPSSCGSLSGSTECDWKFYRDNRAFYIKEEHAIDFTDAGFPLQSQTGGRGYCVDSVEEFYGMTTTYSPDALLANLRSNFPGAFPEDGLTVTSPGPHLYGVGVYTTVGQGGTSFWLTIIRITLTKAPPCSCSLTVCSASA